MKTLDDDHNDDNVYDFNTNMGAMSSRLYILKEIASEADFIAHIEQEIKIVPEILSAETDGLITVLIHNSELKNDNDEADKLGRVQKRIRNYRAVRPNIEIMRPIHTERSQLQDDLEAILNADSFEEMRELIEDNPDLLSDETISRLERYAQEMDELDLKPAADLIHIGLQRLQLVRGDADPGDADQSTVTIAFLTTEASDLQAFIDVHPEIITIEMDKELSQMAFDVPDILPRVYIALRRNNLLTALRSGEKVDFTQYIRLEEKALMFAQNSNDLSAVARLLMDEDHKLAARDLFDLEIHSKPNSTAAWINKAIIMSESFQDFEQSIHCYEQALKLAQERKDDKTTYRVVEDLGQLFLQQGDLTAAANYLEQALTLSRRLGNKSNESEMLGSLGVTWVHASKYDQAAAYFKKALAIHHELGNRSKEVLDLKYLGGCYVNMRDFQSAVECYHKRLAINEELRNQEQIADDLGNIGLTYRDLGDWKRAIEYYQRAIDELTKLGDKKQLMYRFANLSDAYNKTGKPAKAQECYQQAEDLRRQLLVEALRSH